MIQRTEPREAVETLFFLRTVVSDYFTGEDAEAYKAAQDDLKNKAKARKEREERTAKLRKAFEERLAKVLNEIEKGTPSTEANQILAELDKALAAALKSHKDPGEAIATAERSAHNELVDVAAWYLIDQPVGFGLDSELRATWSHYDSVIESLERDVWGTARAKVGARVGVALEKSKAPTSPAQRLRGLVVDTSERARHGLDTQRHTTDEALQHTNSTVQSFMDQSLREFDEVVTEALAKLASRAGDVNSDLDERRREVETPILEAADRGRAALVSIAAQLRAVRAIHGEDGLEISDLDALDALEEEVIEWRERGAAELELAQLGMGIQIVGHEFNSSVGAVRAALRQLKPWADANDGLKRPYGDLRTGFEHLEGYLRLLAPLQRRLNRRRSRIGGTEIAAYVEALFERRLESRKIEFRVTDTFAHHEVVAFRSTIYPAFTALVDNALYWVGERKGKRWIEFDADDEAMFVSNSGPAIPERDRQRVFEMGFTRKPGGQGMGLFVVHESLKAQGFTIDLVDTGKRWAWRIGHSDD